jgi:hypothetical protein
VHEEVTLSYKDALDMFFERSNAMQTFWNFYLTVIFALIALFASIRPVRNLNVLKWCVLLGFIVFAIVNLGALVNVADQRLRLAGVVGRLASTDVASSTLAPSLDPPQVWQVWVLHIVGDLVTIAAIWLLTATKQREAAEMQPGTA